MNFWSLLTVSIARSNADDGARPFLARRAQRELGAARELAAGGGMARRLRNTGMRAHPHHAVDPMRARDRLDDAADDRFDIGLGACGQHHGEFVAADAAVRRLRRQRVTQSFADGDDELVGAEHAELGVDVGHAVELDQREAHHFVGGAFGEREIEQLERLGVVGQAGELVLVGGAARQLLARRHVAARALELAQGKAGKDDERDGDGAEQRHQPVHRRSSWDRSCPR